MWLTKTPLCEHAFEEHERYYGAPPESFKGPGAEPGLWERLAFGVTTILLKCTKCGFIETVEILGKRMNDK